MNPNESRFPSSKFRGGPVSECCQTRLVERDVEGLFAGDEHGTGRLPFRFFHPLPLGVDDVSLAALLEIAIEQGKRRGVHEGFIRRLLTPFQPNDDVRPRGASCMQPEVVALGQAEGQFVVLFGISAHVDWETVG